MNETIKDVTIFITVGKMYVSHVSHSKLKEEILKLDLDKPYGNLNESHIDKCYKFDSFEEAKEVCSYLLEMGLQAVINKRSTVIRNEKFPVTKENQPDDFFDDLAGGVSCDPVS
ncbi:hypothetical protein [Bacillus phage vB_Bpu_PumA1]|uniref:Uncharacterized protein n=1 Tax=Bacillus phage vB_Bpu_PumA1 TaxID=2662127 RepID=A0A5Q2WDT5_9CAUD|nr:hypothetical protein H3020_gp05 [Bacillus phage vB_Bpu_PumA1]QGH74198.1 hypothetical protein [Bacillus phage vB_Bpu_PumA1]